MVNTTRAGMIIAFNAVNLDHCIMIDSKIFHLRQQSEKTSGPSVGKTSHSGSKQKCKVSKSKGWAKPHVLRLPALSPFVIQ